MTPYDFVSVVKNEIRDSAVSTSLEQLKKPSGRKPATEILTLSNWFNGLSESDRHCVVEVIKMTAHHTVFGFLCVLDGVRSIGSEDGELQLTYVNTKGSYRLNDNDKSSDFLHDILNSEGVNNGG